MFCDLFIKFLQQSVWEGYDFNQSEESQLNFFKISIAWN